MAPNKHISALPTENTTNVDKHYWQGQEQQTCIPLPPLRSVSSNGSVTASISQLNSVKLLQSLNMCIPLCFMDIALLVGRAIPLSPGHAASSDCVHFLLCTR
jgi:hypothetical protein